MNGLPERLRNMGLDTFQGAADEIERLRAVEEAHIVASAEDADEIEDLRAEVERWKDLARGANASFCTHCGTKFPKGEDCVKQFKQHISECDAHPLHPMAEEIEKLRAERDEALVKAHEWRVSWEKHHATIGGLRSELDKLRSMLNKFDPQTW